jgi:hypothetical protein
LCISWVIDATVAELAKREKDTVRLLAAKNRLLKIIHKAYYQNANVLQFPKNEIGRQEGVIVNETRNKQVRIK